MRKKRNDKEIIICLTPKPSQNFFVYLMLSKEVFSEKELLKEKGESTMEQNLKEGFFNCSLNGD